MPKLQEIVLKWMIHGNISPSMGIIWDDIGDNADELLTIIWGFPEMGVP